MTYATDFVLFLQRTQICIYVSIQLYKCVYIYIYTHKYTCIYIHIYIYTLFAASLGPGALGPG